MSYCYKGSTSNMEPESGKALCESFLFSVFVSHLILIPPYRHYVIAYTYKQT